MFKKLFILIILLIIGFGGFYFYQRSDPQEVSYIQVQQVDYYDKILTTGTVLLEGLTEIKTEVSGKIVELKAVEGDEVEQREILLQFETIDVYLDLKQAEASYTLAKSRY